MTGNTSPTIVVGYDGSDAARAAFAHARRRAGNDGRVFVVHAYHLPADFLGFPSYDELLAERQRQGRAVLSEVAPDGDDAHLETELIGGSPAEVIAEVARVRDADEIVVGARGRSRARALLGSVSGELLHIADRPVVVIPAAAVAAHAAAPAA
jgi:nucleotide-binding universal stress UspA family protein